MNCSCHPVKASFEVEAARARVVEAGKVVVARLRGKVPNVDTIFAADKMLCEAVDELAQLEAAP